MTYNKNNNNTTALYKGNKNEILTTTTTTTTVLCPHPELTLLPENFYKPPSIESLLLQDGGDANTNANAYAGMMMEKNQNHTTIIPNIIHMTYKTRCMTQTYIQNIEAWKEQFPNHTIYVHDDDDVDDLFRYFFASTTSTGGTNQTTETNQPFLNIHKQSSRIVQYCIPNGATKADLWRYLVLYTYGGIYTDVDNLPSKELLPAFTMIHRNNQRNSNDKNDDDGHTIILDALLLQKTALAGSFLAMSKHHPLMQVALGEALEGLVQVKDFSTYRANKVTGPGAVQRAFTKLTGIQGSELIQQKKQQQKLQQTKLLSSSWLYTVINDYNNNDNDKNVKKKTTNKGNRKRKRNTNRNTNVNVNTNGSGSRTITVLSSEDYPTISHEEKLHLYNLTNVTFWKNQNQQPQDPIPIPTKQEKSGATSSSCQEILSRHFPGIIL